jgi:hypothetical protein
VVLDRLSAPDARILRTVAAPSGADEEPHYEIFHDVLAPAVLGWRAVFDGRRQAEAAAARQLEERAIQWRRRARIWGALLVAIVIAALAVVARNEANTAKALAFKAGRSAEGNRHLEQGGKIAAEYRALARQDQYRYCARALPQGALTGPALRSRGGRAGGGRAATPWPP